MMTDKELDARHCSECSAELEAFEDEICGDCEEEIALEQDEEDDEEDLDDEDELDDEEDGE